MSEQYNSPFEESADISADTNDTKSASPRWQFSMRTLFGLSLVFVFVCSSMATVHYILGIETITVIAILMLVFTIPAMLTTGAIYSRGYRRTFFIGTMFPGIGGVLMSYFLLGMFYHEGNPLGSIVLCMTGWSLTAIVSGTASIIMRWLIEPQA